jgi:hypothetical protein
MWPYDYDSHAASTTPAPPIKIDFDKVQILTREKAEKLKKMKNQSLITELPVDTSSSIESIPRKVSSATEAVSEVVSAELS